MPANRGNANGEQQPAQRRSKRKQLREDLRALQNQLREARAAERQAREDHAALMQRLENQPADAPHGNADDQGVAQLNKSEIRFWKRSATVAGRRCAVLHAPFLDGDCLADHRVQGNFEQILDRVQRSKDSDEDLEDDDNPAMYWDHPRFSVPSSVDLAEEMIVHLPKSPGAIWLESWFQDAIKLGIRKQRGDIVHAVAKRYEKIFDIHDPAFEDRKNRSELEEVEVLMATFLHIGEENAEGELDLTMFFRDECIVRVIRLLLNGPSAIRTGRRSSKSRKSHAQMWQIKKVTPSLLAFAATVIKFVLSGEPSFDEAGQPGGVNYSQYYFARLQILEEVYDINPEVYHDLITYHSRAVFPDLYHDNDEEEAPGAGENVGHAGMSAADENFLQRLRGAI